ncbi:hypothetical protein TSA1_15115 [Bradyrhizobium nitroreducens]|uniref:Hemolysin activation/secretion protein n=2 Tax=Bradyrhizobium nitroreducens TaxID=709803 RepID=A0A2M6UBF7_9BRAD|nr:hypothetical protein TSA1_15115 [Bradyrhizobium nitroreducens]
MQMAHAQQSVPSPSQVAPPEIRPAPSAPTRILLPRVEVGQAVPEQAKKLNFILTGFDIEGEFAELEAQRRELERSLVGKRVTVAQVFEFGAALQALYVRAGYPLVRVIVSPQELDKAARVKIRVVDGFIERIDAEAIASLTRPRVVAVLERLIGKRHLTQGELERQLLIAGDAPGLELNAVFTGGKEIGGSILVLSGRYKPVSASIYGDNAMPVVFGTGQMVTSASLNGVLGLGEQVSVSASGLPDADFVTANPTRRYLSATVMIPLGVDGWRVEASGTQGKTTPRVDPIFSSQGLLTQGRVKLAFDAVKRRDAELTLSGRLDSTDEEVDSLLFTPAIPLSRDRLRVVRAAADGIWRLRESGTVVSYGAMVSQGLNALGARTAADASPLLPLSRAGADAVFTKFEGRFQVTQNLPENFFVSLAAFGQTSFNRPLLKSEQYDLVGAQMLSGYNAGSFAGDSAWATRAEIGRNIAWPSEILPIVLTPYLFGASGERLLAQPSALELASLHASNLGGGLRLYLPVFGTFPASFSGFVEGSRQHSNDPTQQGWRLFAGGSLHY